MQVNHEAGISFATALRSILRLDPDVILVGEIRDQETAGIATQAALTGHLVLTSLHANDSVSGLLRLRDLVLQRRISKCDVWPFVFGHERAIAVGSWQYVVRFKLVTKTTLPDKLSL